MATARNTILYEVKGKTAIITLNSPKNYNALGHDGYSRLNALIQQAAEEKDTVATLIQSTGKFFSAGADVKSGTASDIADIADDADENEAYYTNQLHYAKSFGARNQLITNAFARHPKVLVVALNGPVIGLSAALIALADFIYALDSTYFLVPFANLGLVSEGASAYTVIRRLGWSLGSEALLSSRPIPANVLNERGFFNGLYPQSQFKSVEEFNQSVQKTIEERLYHLNPESLAGIKQIIRSTQIQDITTTNQDEVIGGITMFTKGYPQQEFLKMASKQKRHKL